MATTTPLLFRLGGGSEHEHKIYERTGINLDKVILYKGTLSNKNKHEDKKAKTKSKKKKKTTHTNTNSNNDKQMTNDTPQTLFVVLQQ